MSSAARPVPPSRKSSSPTAKNKTGTTRPNLSTKLRPCTPSEHENCLGIPTGTHYTDTHLEETTIPWQSNATLLSLWSAGRAPCAYTLPPANRSSLPRTVRRNSPLQVVRDEYSRCADRAHCHGHIQPCPRGKHCPEYEHDVNHCTQSTLPLYDSHNVRLRAIDCGFAEP